MITARKVYLSRGAVVLLLSSVLMVESSLQPNIIVIMADDLGWNDVSFHGSNKIQTPNIDALAYSGVILNRHYVLPQCTPSRAAFLTGRYPFRFGLQGYPLRSGERTGLPLTERLLPEYLKQLGYKTHLVGKWHLGFSSHDYTPCSRGFDSYLGYYNGYLDYYSQGSLQTVYKDTKYYGHDVHDCVNDRWEWRGEYTTEMLTDRSVDIIRQHDKKKPLFLQINHNAVHTGNSSHALSGLEIPEGVDVNNLYTHLKNKESRMLAGMIQSLDKSVGVIIDTLHKQDMLSNSIILFFSDNGGSTVSTQMEPNLSSNYPLRGVKFSLFEGGVRAATAVWSPLLQSLKVSNCLMHVTDWLPTLYSAAGGKVDDLDQVDGVDQWSDLKHKTCTQTEGKRSEIVLNIDPRENTEAIITENKWKLIKGGFRSQACYDYHYGDTEIVGNVPAYTIHNLQKSPTGAALLSVTNNSHLFDNVETIRKMASVECKYKLEGGEFSNDAPNACNLPDSGGYVSESNSFYCKDYCLFDVIDDPCEYTNVAAENQNVVHRLSSYLNKIREGVVYPINDGVIDIESNPDKHNGSWKPWMDRTNNNSSCIRNSIIQYFVMFHVLTFIVYYMKI